jgi:NADH:ubiquinone oxidoreductase subunit 2 (subunit N)
MIIPLIFLAVPLVAAALTYLLRRWVWAQAILAALTAAALALLAAQAPLNTVAVFMNRDVTFNASWVVLGRSFTFTEAERPALAFLYLTSLLFFSVAGAARTPRSFLPVGLVILSLMAGTIFVQPFLFAALFIEMIAAFAVLILADNEHTQTRGAMRLLVFVTLAVPFILLAGWQLEGLETSPEDTSLLVRAAVMLNVGLIILLAVVPFHSWIPNVAEDSAQIASAFVFTVVQAAVLFFMLKFFTQFDWFRNNPAEFAGLRLAGAAMVLGGGALAFAQRRFGRLMGYAVIVDLGATLLAVSVSGVEGLRVALSIVALRGVGLAVWGLGLGWVRAQSRRTNSDDFDDVQGLAWKMPFATAALILGGLSLTALPLTAGFAGRWALFRLLAPKDYGISILLLLAGVSVTLSYARGIAALFRVVPEPTSEEGRLEPAASAGPHETPAAIVFVCLGVATILVLGIFPQWLLPAVAQAAEAFAK